MESFKLLNGFAHSYKLEVIGEGPQLIELNAMVQNYGLVSKVIFAGFQERIDEWFAATDIFVLPSLTEGTPMVLLEAMAHGVPCIASAVGGIPMIIESGVDGILVPPEQPEEIRDAIIDSCTNKAKEIPYQKMLN